MKEVDGVYVDLEIDSRSQDNWNESDESQSAQSDGVVHGEPDCEAVWRRA